MKAVEALLGLILAGVVLWGLVALLSNPVGQFIAVMVVIMLFLFVLKRNGGSHW